MKAKRASAPQADSVSYRYAENCAVEAANMVCDRLADLRERNPVNLEEIERSCKEAEERLDVLHEKCDRLCPKSSKAEFALTRIERAIAKTRLGKDDARRKIREEFFGDEL